MSDPIVVSGLTNQEFFDTHARPGRIGLVGGAEITNRLIARAQRHLDADGTWSHWSHAFLFQGRRADGHHWIIESDLLESAGFSLSREPDLVGAELRRSVG